MTTPITVEEFVNLTLDDIKSPVTSDFGLKVNNFRQVFLSLDESAENGKITLQRIRKTVKHLYESGIARTEYEKNLSKHLQDLHEQSVSSSTDNEELEVASGLNDVGVVLQEISTKFRNLMQVLNNTMVYPLETFLKGDVKGDIRKPFDKAWRDYEVKFEKLRKERIQLAKGAGLQRTDVSPADLAEDLEKEKRTLQYSICDYLIKVNDIRSKKGAELLQHLIDYYQVQMNYFSESLERLNNLSDLIANLTTKCKSIKSIEDTQRRLLVTTRDQLRKLIDKDSAPTAAGSSPGANVKKNYRISMPQGNLSLGTEKEGILSKKSESRVKKVWQHRRVRVAGGAFWLHHGDPSKPPVALNLLTSHIHEPSDDPSGKCFDLISNNRTYHFQAEDEAQKREWLSVLYNAQNEVLNTEMMKPSSMEDRVPSSMGAAGGSDKNQYDSKHFIDLIMNLPGNDKCCDCGLPNPSWCSVNLGVLICLKCSGIHRALGVQVSRVQSLTIDNLPLNNLLLLRFVGNNLFNEIFEATLTEGIKPNPVADSSSDVDSLMELRKNFIRAKYEGRRYILVTSGGMDSRYLLKDLARAVKLCNIKGLIQTFSEQCELMAPLNDSESGDPKNTALHIALSSDVTITNTHYNEQRLEKRQIIAGDYLALIEFILQNSTQSSLGVVNSQGDSILHYAARYNRYEAMKLILNAVGSSNQILMLPNENGQTALDIAEQFNNHQCADLLKSATKPSDSNSQQTKFSPSTSKYVSALSLKVESIDWQLDFHLPVIREPSIGKIKPHRNRPSELNRFGYHVQSESDSSDSTPKDERSFSFQGVITADNDLSSEFSVDRRVPPNKDFNYPFTNSGTRNSMGLHSVNNSFSSLKYPKDRHRQEEKSTSDSFNHPSATLPKSFLNKSQNLEEDQAFSYFGLPSDFTSLNTRSYNDNAKSTEAISPRRRDYSNSKEVDDSDHINVLLDVLEEKPQNSVIPFYSLSSSASLPQLNTSPIKNIPFKPRRVKALYDSSNENKDELHFRRGDIIVVTNSNDSDWWEGFLESDPNAVGLFPVTYVHILNSDTIKKPH